MESTTQQPAVPAIGSLASVVVLLRIPVLGVVDLLDARVRAQRVGDDLGVVVDAVQAADEVARVALHEYGVLVEVEIFEGCCEVGFQGGVVASLRVQNETV